MPSRSSRAIKSAAATSFVFLNCPFDDQYKPLFEALVFTIHACGFTARCALEDGGSEAVRLQRIIKMIQTCQLGIHDLSRVDTQGQLPRFNMPFELGLFIGAKTFGDVRQHRKKFLVLEGERYQYKRFISDSLARILRRTTMMLQKQSSRFVSGFLIRQARRGPFQAETGSCFSTPSSVKLYPGYWKRPGRTERR
jgi:hypothetical protein